MSDYLAQQTDRESELLHVPLGARSVPNLQVRESFYGDAMKGGGGGGGAVCAIRTPFYSSLCAMHGMAPETVLEATQPWFAEAGIPTKNAVITYSEDVTLEEVFGPGAFAVMQHDSMGAKEPEVVLARMVRRAELLRRKQALDRELAMTVTGGGIIFKDAIPQSAWRSSTVDPAPMFAPRTQQQGKDAKAAFQPAPFLRLTAPPHGVVLGPMVVKEDNSNAGSLATRGEKKLYFTGGDGSDGHVVPRITMIGEGVYAVEDAAAKTTTTTTKTHIDSFNPSSTAGQFGARARDGSDGMEAVGWVGAPPSEDTAAHHVAAEPWHNDRSIPRPYADYMHAASFRPFPGHANAIDAPPSAGAIFTKADDDLLVPTTVHVLMYLGKPTTLLVVKTLTDAQRSILEGGAATCGWALVASLTSRYPTALGLVGVALHKYRTPDYPVAEIQAAIDMFGATQNMLEAMQRNADKITTALVGLDTHFVQDDDADQAIAVTLPTTVPDSSGLATALQYIGAKIESAHPVVCRGYKRKPEDDYRREDAAKRPDIKNNVLAFFPLLTPFTPPPATPPDILSDSTTTHDDSLTPIVV